jgi:hypothetical protein
LVGVIRDTSAKAVATTGVAATDLSDGLQKLAAGRLTPEALEVYVNFLTNRWWMRVVGRDVDASEGDVFTNPVRRRLVLDRREFLELFDLVKPTDKGWDGRMPGVESVDLSVEVLNRKRSLQGRPATKPAGDIADRAKEFDRAVGWPGRLHRRVMERGYAVTK